jgi:tetratricopeptide (TPR) repeat protein
MVYKEKNILSMMKKILLMKKLSLLLLLPVIACGSSNAPIVSNSDVETKPEQTELLETDHAKQEKPKECLKPFGETPEDSLETRKNISLFTQEFNDKNYEAAYPFWKYIMTNAPCVRVSPYIDGVVMFQVFIDDPKNASKREVLIDSLLSIFPNRIKYHNEEGMVKGYWMYYLNMYRPNDYMEIIKLGDEAMNLENEKTLYIVPTVYMTSILKAFQAKKITADQLFSAYEKVNTIIEANIKKQDAYVETWKQIQTGIEGAVNPFFKCEDIDNIFMPRVKENANDIELHKKVISYYRAAKCSDNKNYIKILNDVFAKQPEASSAEELAKYYEQNNNMKQANDFWEKAADLEKDDKKKEFYYLKLANNNLKSGNMSTAVNYSNKVLSINSNSGNAYIILAIAKFNQAQSSCDKAFDKAAAAWVAIDYLEKAIAVDPSVREDAQSKINNYKKNAPKREQIFFQNLGEGDSYTIDCIGSTTKVRVFE